MKYLVIGGNGQVGHALVDRLSPLADVVATTRSGQLPDGRPCVALDVTDTQALAEQVQREAPDVVINASAYTAVDRAESEPELAHRINADAPRTLAQVCASTGTALVHFSTDYVFDGSGSRPYREDDDIAPLGVYGASKWAGEQAVRDSGAAHKIFRLCWVYGPRGSNFLLTMLRLGRDRDQLGVVADQVGSPTSAGRIADGVARAMAARPGINGTWHLAAEGETSWHGFAQSIFQGAVGRGLLARAPRVDAITSAQYPTPARRPAYSRLDTGRFQRDFGFHIGDWRQGLDEVLLTLAAPARGP